MEPQTDFQLDIMTGLDTYSARQIRERIDANFTQGTQRAPLGAYFATGIKKAPSEADARDFNEAHDVPFSGLAAIVGPADDFPLDPMNPSKQSGGIYKSTHGLSTNHRTPRNHLLMRAVPDSHDVLKRDRPLTVVEVDTLDPSITYRTEFHLVQGRRYQATIR
ncbi:hypothetical protein HOC01_03750 [archaeon]|jgi:hypothetical protein|nr:hypothetical protein [archaeon]MBT6698474.1 hypothetical protein [archaeon]